MKIGIFSDLHLEFGHWYFNDFKDDVYYINAGDTHPEARERLYLTSKIRRGLHIMGNHDYYGGSFIGTESHIYSDLVRNNFYEPIDSNDTPMSPVRKIAGATLWTDLWNPTNWNLYTTGLVDFRHTKDMTHDRYMLAYEMHKQFLLTSDADVIVSHHAPSYLSVAERYKGDAYNCCFATELHDDILNMPKPPKLWIHGHMHNRSDYMIGNTRVICHPRGYPNENTWYQNYEPLIVEI